MRSAWPAALRSEGRHDIFVWLSRRLAWSVVLAVLAVGGVAFAQPGLIVDPWKVSRTRGVELSSWRMGEPFATTAAANALIVDPWRTARPLSNARPTTRGMSVKREARLRSAEIRDPWADSSAVARSAPSPRAGTWVASSEIVDPWAASSKRAPPRADSSIVDLWRR
jgi:hypothetical protein